jgi:hypothetical protein
MYVCVTPDTKRMTMVAAEAEEVEVKDRQAMTKKKNKKKKKKKRLNQVRMHSSQPGPKVERKRVCCIVVMHVLYLY